MTITIPLWLPLAYLAVGAVLWLPLEYRAWRALHRRPPFWREFGKGLRRRPWVPLLMALAWPVALWEDLR